MRYRQGDRAPQLRSAARLAFQLPDQPLDLLGALQDRCALGCQADAATVPDEKRLAEFSFELGDPATERRLGNTQFLGCAAEAARPGHGGEVAKAAEVHGKAR